MTFKLAGRTAIFVGGDLARRGALNIDLAPGAELDLFVGGRVSMTGALAFGSTAEPARIRMYVGGDSVAVSGGMKLGVNLYAHHAVFAASGSLEMSGSIFAKHIAQQGTLTIHYDEAVLDSEGCAPPDQTCKTCQDRSGT